MKEKRLILRDWSGKEAESYWCWIYVSGNYEHIEQICRRYVLEGGCVSIEPVKYIYQGAVEDGVRIGLINYARFPESKDKIYNDAVLLGIKVAEQGAQLSFTVIDSERSVFFSRVCE